MDKKQLQLGMNPSTAAHRLRMDTLFRLANKAGETCFRCGGELRREDFSIDHKKPWLDTENPKQAFFDQENVAFSHMYCNIADARKPSKKYFSEAEKCAGRDERSRRAWNRLSKEAKQLRRRGNYLRNGC